MDDYFVIVEVTACDNSLQKRELQESQYLLGCSKLINVLSLPSWEIIWRYEETARFEDQEEISASWCSIEFYMFRILLENNFFEEV